MLKVNSVIYPIDLDHIDADLIQNALEIAKQYSADIHILYINNPQAGYRSPYEHEDTVALKVQEVVSHDLLHEVKVTYAVSKGEIGKAVAEYCSKVKGDLIITGHRHHNSLFNALFDSPDEQILDSVMVPVLILPKK